MYLRIHNTSVALIFRVILYGLEEQFIKHGFRYLSDFNWRSPNPRSKRPSLSTSLLLHGLGRALDEGPRFDGLLPHPVPKMQLVLPSTLKPAGTSLNMLRLLNMYHVA